MKFTIVCGCWNFFYAPTIGYRYEKSIFYFAALMNHLCVEGVQSLYTGCANVTGADYSTAFDREIYSVDTI